MSGACFVFFGGSETRATGFPEEAARQVPGKRKNFLSLGSVNSVWNWQRFYFLAKESDEKSVLTATLKDHNLGIKKLISKCKKQDIKAQEQLYKLYAHKIFPVCLKYSSDYQ